jgi:protein-arginine kinase activator protein McsA
MIVGKMFHHIKTDDDIEMVTAVCPFCYALSKNVILERRVLCAQCDNFFTVGLEIISVRIKVQGEER